MLPGKGRALIVLDSEALPVRHVSFAAKVDDPQQALDRFRLEVATMNARFGAPTKTVGDIDPADPFPLLQMKKLEWRFTDLRAEVSGMSFGKRGVEVKSTLEVPWPVRADAPTLPSPQP